MFGGDVYSEAGAEVELTGHIWPNQQALLALPVGAAVPTIPVPLAVSGNSYSVRLDIADVPADYRDKNGVEVLVEAFSDGRVDSYGEQLRPAAGGGWKRNPLVEAQTARASTFRVASGATETETPGTLTLRSTPSRTTRTASAPLQPATLVDGAGAEPEDGMAAAGCNRKWNKTGKTWIRTVKISDVMPAKRFMKGKVRYHVGTSHSIQVAVKVGTSVSGGSNRTVSASENVNPTAWHGDKVAWTKWRMRRYTHDCAPSYHQARPERHEGGFRKTKRSRPSYKKCMRYAKGSWSNARGKAWTYKAGFALWNHTFDAQTGYNTKTVLVYKFPNRHAWLCGNNASPPHAQLVAGYRKNQ